MYLHSNVIANPRESSASGEFSYVSNHGEICEMVRVEAGAMKGNSDKTADVEIALGPRIALKLVANVDLQVVPRDVHLSTAMLILR